MAFKVKLIPVVKTEINVARDWYRKIDPELPKRLTEEIHSALNIIAKNPIAYAIRYKSVRRYNLRVFPYFLHYLVEEKSSFIKVIGFYHQQQHPDSWNKEV